MLYASDLVRWLQRKRYQYEVTFSLYMLTPTEKFIFSTFDSLADQSAFSSANQPHETIFSLLLLLFPTARFVKPPSIMPRAQLFDIALKLALMFPSADTFLVLFISMIIVAASLYLPEHVMKMASRAWFYYAGDETASGGGTRAGSGAGAVGPRHAGRRADGQDVLDRLGSL